MKHLSEEDLILVYYGEPDAPEDAKEHLRQCGECAEAADALRRTMELCDAVSVPEPAANFSEKLWQRLDPQLKETKRRSAWKTWLAPSLGFAAAVVALIVALPFTRTQPTQSAGLPDAARNRILAMSLADHLDRSQMLLTELENSDDVSPNEMEPLRSRAQDLVDESRLMREWIARGEHKAALPVVDEVERVLMETANGGGRPEDIRALREQIGADSLLFKVRIVEANLRTEGQKS